MWHRSANKYLTMLRQSHNTTVSAKAQPAIEEAVITDCHRLYWRMGLVTTMYPGNNGLYYVAQLKIVAGTMTFPPLHYAHLT